MDINQAFPSKYLKSSDLQGRKVTVIMGDVKTEEIGQKRDLRPVLYFKGKDKGLVLNKTNVRRIASVYGNNTEQWFGQPITLFEAQVEFQGEIVPAIRVLIPATNADAIPERVPNGIGSVEKHLTAPDDLPEQTGSDHREPPWGEKLDDSIDF